MNKDMDTEREGGYFGWRTRTLDFIAGMRKRNFEKFVLFVSLMNFSVNIAYPFFTVLMLKDLHFSYLL